MTDADARQLIQRYATSYFFEDSAEGWFHAAKNGRSISSRAIGGSQVPILKGRELAAAMIGSEASSIWTVSSPEAEAPPRSIHNE